MNPLRHYPILSSLLRPFRLSQQKTCAALVAAICQAAQASSFAIAGQLSCLTKVQFGSALTRLYRFLRNERFDNWLLTERLLKLLAQPNKSLLLALDWTSWQDRFSVLTASVCVDTRSIPLAASACVKRNLARSQNLWEETFLRLVVERLRAAQVSAIWLCDRGFHRVAWLKKFVEMEQRFVVRLQRDVTVHLKDGTCLLKSLEMHEGERRDFGFVQLRADGFVRVRLIGVWAKGAKEGNNILGSPKSQDAGLQAEPDRLSFKSHDDALNYARKLVEDSNRWLVVHEFNAANRYMLGDVEIRINFTAGLNAENFHFVFRAIPDRVHNVSAVPRKVIHHKATAVNSDGADELMFIGVTELVQCPQEVVPSFVWLERAHEVNDFFRQVFAPASYAVLKFSFVVGEGEVGESSALPKCDGDGIQGMIEGGAQVVNGVNSDMSQSGGHGLGELDLMHILRCIRIELNDVTVWVAIEELGNLPIKFTDAVLCPINTAP
jgi:hypothetical protein